MAYLVLVRHGLSTYNEQGLWAGWDDPELTDQGRKEAEKAAAALTDIYFDKAYTSLLKRAKDTLTIILSTLRQSNIPVIKTQELNERNYGIYTAKNKWEIKKQLGDEEFFKLRRGWNYPIPNGETLKQVSERVIPYYVSIILPELKLGKNILIASSGNELRALVKYLDQISDEGIAHFEIGTGEVLVYEIDQTGVVIKKEKRVTNPNRV